MRRSREDQRTTSSPTHAKKSQNYFERLYNSRFLPFLSSVAAMALGLDMGLGLHKSKCPAGSRLLPLQLSMRVEESGKNTLCKLSAVPASSFRMPRGNGGTQGRCPAWPRPGFLGAIPGCTQARASSLTVPLALSCTAIWSTLHGSHSGPQSSCCYHRWENPFPQHLHHRATKARSGVGWDGQEEGGWPAGALEGWI